MIEDLLQRYETLLVRAEEEAQGEGSRAAKHQAPSEGCGAGCSAAGSKSWRAMRFSRCPGVLSAAYAPPPAGLRRLRSVADGWLEEARPVLEQDFVTGEGTQLNRLN